MLKIIGGLIVVLSSFLFGNDIRKNLKYECEFTENLADGLCAVREEIRYNSDYLLNSMKKAILLSGTAKNFFEIFCNEMISGKSADEAWNAASFVVPCEDVRVLLADSDKKIGKTDSDGQLAIFDLLIDKLKIIHEKQLTAYEKQGGLYPKFAIASGILITILLI